MIKLDLLKGKYSEGRYNLPGIKVYNKVTIFRKDSIGLRRDKLIENDRKNGNTSKNVWEVHI